MPLWGRRRETDSLWRGEGHEEDEQTNSESAEGVETNRYQEDSEDSWVDWKLVESEGIEKVSRPEKRNPGR